MDRTAKLRAKRRHFAAAIAAALAVSTAFTANADPLAPADRLAFADGLFARELYELAVQEYTAFLEDFPSADGAAARYRLGDCYRQLGKAAEAQREYGRVFREHPGSEYALKAGLKRAEIFVAQKRYADGVELYRQVLERKPEPDVASACSYFSGEALLELGRTNEARQAYEVVAAKHESSAYHPFALLRLAEIGVTHGVAAADLVKLYRAAATNSVSERAAAEALYQLGRMKFDSREFEDSSSVFAELAKRFPDDKRTGQSKLDSAWAQYCAGFHAKALGIADEALGSKEGSGQPAAADWLYLKANCERSLGKYAEAVATYDRLTALGGEKRHVHIYERALCHFARDEHAQVIKQLDGMENHADIRQDVLWLLARSSQETGGNDSAVQYYRKLSSEFPRGRFAEEALFRLAAILQAAEEWKAASETYAALVSAFPAGRLATKAMFSSGVCDLNAGRDADAIEAWLTLVKNHPNDELAPEALLSAAVSQMKSGGRMDAARQSVESFLKNYGRDRKANEAWFWKGIMEMEGGDHKGARQSFETAIGMKLEGALLEKARAYGALALYRSGDQKGAADALQGLSSNQELKYAGRNVLLWLTEYRLHGKESGKACDAAAKTLMLSELPIEKQEAYCLQGRALEADGKQKESVSCYDQAYKIDEASAFRAEAALALGGAALAGQRHDEAARLYDEAARMSSDDGGVAVRARAYMGLGSVAAAVKDHSKAARYFMSVAVLFDDPEMVPRSLEQAASSYGAAGMAAEQKLALDELKKRYPGSAGSKGAVNE